MNELITRTTHLPDTLEDLTQFVLVGKSKLNAYMLRLRTVNRLSVAQEIRNQTLEETQELANALIAAEQRIGELLLAIPKASGGDHGNQYASAKNPDGGNFGKSKAETIKEMGYGKNEAADFQQMAKNPEIVRKVIEEATASGEVVTKSAVMKQIQRAKEEARQEAQAEIDRLRADNRTLARRSAPEQKVVEREVVPEDYEDTKRRLKDAQYDFQRMSKDMSDAKAENARLRKENKALAEQVNSASVTKEADRDIAVFTIATNDYIRRYGGHVWAFSEIQNVPKETRNNFLQAIKTLDGFAQQLIANLGGNE